MGFHRIHYLDTSVLVKLLVKEDGSDVIEEYMSKEYTSAFKTISLCFGEALGVLKLKYVGRNRPDHIDLETYLTGADELRAYVEDGRINLVDVGMSDNEVFAQVEEIVRRHSLDVVDATLIVSVQGDCFSRLFDAKPILVAADEQLAKAAFAEGLDVWDCIREKAP
jgi:predicted nucleic acid-binding protein